MGSDILHNRRIKVFRLRKKIGISVYLSTMCCFRPNLNKNIFRLRVLIPQLQIEGRYKTDAKVLFLNLKGEGPAFVNISK